jgi:hypothetical protein
LAKENWENHWKRERQRLLLLVVAGPMMSHATDGWWSALSTMTVLANANVYGETMENEIVTSTTRNVTISMVTTRPMTMTTTTTTTIDR